MSMKIRSVSDVITNSSSESYIIKNSGNKFDVEEAFDKFMKKNHNDEWDEAEWTSCKPDQYVDGPGDGDVTIDWLVLCNLDDAYKYLRECFGEKNVEPEYDNRW